MMQMLKMHWMCANQSERMCKRSILKETTFQWSGAINVQSCFPYNLEKQSKLVVKQVGVVTLFTMKMKTTTVGTCAKYMLKANEIHTLWDFIDILNLNSKLKMFIILCWLTRWPVAIVLAFHACVNPFDNSNSTAQWSPQITQRLE